jgi:hypothetical protein
MCESLAVAGGGAFRTSAWQEAFPLSCLPRSFSAAANSLALLARPALGRFLISAAALHLAKQAFALELFLQDPQGLFDIVFTNKDFQSWLLSV